MFEGVTIDASKLWILPAFMAGFMLVGFLISMSILVIVKLRKRKKDSAKMYSCPKCAHQVFNADWDERCPYCGTLFF